MLIFCKKSSLKNTRVHLKVEKKVEKRSFYRKRRGDGGDVAGGPRGRPWWRRMHRFGGGSEPGRGRAAAGAAADPEAQPESAPPPGDPEEG